MLKFLKYVDMVLESAKKHTGESPTRGTLSDYDDAKTAISSQNWYVHGDLLGAAD